MSALHILSTCTFSEGYCYCGHKACVPCECLQVDEKEVTRLHTAFYAKVAELFEQHRGSFKGYENVELVMIE